MCKKSLAFTFSNMKSLEKKWIMISFIMATKSEIENHLAEENNLYS